jgi:hypothetical protein
LLVDHNDFTGSSVGFMASGMNAMSKVNFNNFNGNASVYSPPGTATLSPSADLSKNYWGGAPPNLAPNTTNQRNAQGLPTDAYYDNAVMGTGPR